MENNKPGQRNGAAIPLVLTSHKRPRPISSRLFHYLYLAWFAGICWFLIAGADAQSFGTNYTKILLGGIRSSPAIGLNGSIYVGTVDGKLQAVRPQGTVQWTFTGNGEFFATPAIGPNGVIYIGSTGGKFFALSPLGTKLWEFVAGGSIKSSAALSADGTIYFGSDDSKLYALDQNGQLLWTFLTHGSVESSPAIGADGTIYFGSMDGKVYALAPDGTKKWDFATHGAIFSSPAIGSDEMIYIGSRDSYLYALSNQGSNLWTFATQGQINGSPVIDSNGGIYFGSDDTKVYGLNANGTKKWSYATTNAIYGTPSISTNGTLFIGSLDGYVYALNKDSGALVWQFATLGQVFTSPAINLDGSILFGSLDGYLYQLRSANLTSSSSWPMFRRNLRRTASGFVRRSLALGYSPGETMRVILRAIPPPGTRTYTVQDNPPLGWVVDQISDNGLFDTNNLLVKFGPFFDDSPRTLSYEITPPLTQAGVVQFNGWASADGWGNAIGGAASQVFMPAHPADFNPVQGLVTINDLTAYGAAWKQGVAWTIGPNPIPIDYVTSAAALWNNGEYYLYDSNYFAAPLWWVNTGVVESPVGDLVPAATYPSGTDGSTNLVAMSRTYQVGMPVAVQLSVTPATGRVVYAVEDVPPAGWTISNISSPGHWDAVAQKVKWGPFFDNLPRVLSYNAQPPTNASGPVTFTGVTSLDGTNLVFSGQRRATDVPVPPLLTAISVSPDTGAQFTLQSEWGFYYEVQASIDFTNWTTITNFFTTDVTSLIVDPDATGYPQRFYRAVLP